MERYSEYKDSGVQWLGEIPSHWEIVPTKSCLESSTSGIWGNDPINDGSDIICLRVADFNYEKGGIRKDKLTYRNYSKELSNDKVLKDGDLLLEKSGGGDLYPVGRVVRFDSCLSTATCSNFIQILRPKKNVYSSFIYYSFYVKYARKVNGLYFNQTTGIQNLKVKEYLNSPIILPPLSEQQAIATYLDKVTSQIDTAITQQQKMIDLLNERKQIIINNAVTKGLDPNVKMKDSGVDWIGEIPEGWEVRRLKTILHTKDKRNSDPNALLLSVYTAIGVRPRQELEERGNKASTVINYKIVNKGDLIVNRLLAWMGAYGLSDYNGVTSPDYDVYSFQGKVNIHYYETLFRNTQFKSDCYKYGHGIMMMRWRTYSDEFLSINVPIPPKEEQDAIYDYLRPQIKKITEGVYQCEKQISLLQERKQIIINDVVTGKVKV